MDRWTGRVALVTGASAGIGFAVARALVCHGMKVIGCARNVQKIQELAESLSTEKGSLTPISCDVSKEEQVMSMFEKIKAVHGGVDVCINNAGLSHDAPLLSGKTELWRSMLEINVLGLSICTREAVQSMKERNIDDGHVINVNRHKHDLVCAFTPTFPEGFDEIITIFLFVVGHRQYVNNPSGHFYSATKFAVSALTEGLKNELKGTHIRVTSISPGLTETEFAYRMYADDKEKAAAKYNRIENLKPEDIADGVVYTLSAPRHVRVSELTIMTTES